jgi:vacuolar-type H+-ATPase subunit E/Vma4
MTIKAEAKRRLEKDSKELLTSAEIKELLETSKTKQMLLPKQEFQRLMHLKKSMQNFERKVEQVKKDHFLDENAWNEEVQKEMKLMTESMSKLTV